MSPCFRKFDFVLYRNILNQNSYNFLTALLCRLSGMDITWAFLKKRGNASELRFVQTSNKFFRMPCPANIYLFKINNGNRKRCEIRSKLTLKIPAFSVNFEHISRLFLAFLLLTLMREMFTGWANPCLNSVIKTLPE